MAALKDELKAEFKEHLTSLAKHMAEKVTRLEQTLGAEIVNIRMGQQRQFDTLDVRLRQLEATQVEWSSVTGGPLVSTESSSMPAPEVYLSLAAQLAAANPAWQNPKLVGQALSMTPPVLKLFRPKDVLALVKEEQRVLLEHGSLVVHAHQTSEGHFIAWSAPRSGELFSGHLGGGWQNLNRREI